MLDDRAGTRGAERDRHHVDPYLAVLQPVPADVGGSQFGDPPLLLKADGLRRMPVGGVGPRPHLDEYNRAAVESDEVDVSAEHPLPPAHNPVAQAPEELLRLGFATEPDRLPWITRCHGYQRHGKRRTSSGLGRGLLAGSLLRRRLGGSDVVTLLAEADRLANAITEVIQLGPPRHARPFHLDLGNLG